jgi:hypothetical protein
MPAYQLRIATWGFIELKSIPSVLLSEFGNMDGRNVTDANEAGFIAL